MEAGVARENRTSPSLRDGPAFPAIPDNQERSDSLESREGKTEVSAIQDNPVRLGSPETPKTATMREVATIVSNEEAGAGYRLLRLSAPGTAQAARPGQFVHLRVPDFDPVALRRPISICDVGTGVLTLLFKVVGRGTEALARVRAGAEIDVVGPLGNGFPEPKPGAVPVLVGGGYGVAPLYFFARRAIAAGAKPVLFVGARTAADLLILDRFEALGVEVRPATNDGSSGVKGFVTEALDAWLSSRGPDSAPPEFFACGPAPMLRAVEERAMAGGFAAWLSLDRRMACGVGACFGCTQTVRGAGGATEIARVCVDGPVFPSGRIVWDA